MEVRRITAELSAVGERLSHLRQQIISLQEWEVELQTTLKVLQRLGDHDPAQPKEPDFPHITPARPPSGPAPRATRLVTPAKGLAAVAGQAVAEMLRAEGKFIRPMKVVHRLRDQHGITIGLGRPGRETSDLSAAIGHGKVPELIVSRQNGWGLTEWNGTAPADRDSTFTSVHSKRVDQRPSGHQFAEVQPPLSDVAHEHDPEPHLAESDVVGR